MEIDVSRSETRRTAHGIWYQVPCPFCVGKGCGVDRGAHLGLFQSDIRDTIGTNCFRCGTRGSAHSLGIHLNGLRTDMGRSDRFRPLQPFDPPSVSKAFLSDLPSHSVSRRIWAETVAKKWPGLTVDDIAYRGARWTVGDFNTLDLPYTSLTDGTDGYHERRLGRNPKILTFGTPGPSTFNLTDPEPYDGQEVVIVEGWLSGCGVPHEYFPILLNGVGNWRHIPPKLLMRRRIILALDGDDAGRHHSLAFGNSLMKRQAEFAMVFLPEGKDPADIGCTQMQKLIDNAYSPLNAAEYLAKRLTQNSGEGIPTCVASPS